MKKIKIAVCGAEGRMGRSLTALASTDPELDLVNAIGSNDDVAERIARADVVIDFTDHAASLDIARAAAKQRKALVIGTTGHSEAERKAIVKQVKNVPVVWSPNFSTGVAVLSETVRRVAELLGTDFDIAITETHHKTKRDAPSGTAKRLQNIIKHVQKRDVPAYSLRIGDVVGEHTITFAAPGEELMLTHRATSRDAFARGALQAAKWVAHRSPGLYDMRDVLGSHKH